MNVKYDTNSLELFSQLAGDALSAVDAVQLLLRRAAASPATAAKLAGSLLSLSLEPDDAVRILSELAEHHAYLTGRLGGPVDVRVAAMDYVTRHPELVREPVVVDQQLLVLSQRLAAVDELTGLFNRRFLEIYLNKEINRARRHGETFSILFADLDDFKSINDTFGHDVGDEVLVRLAHAIQDLLRTEDFAARYGGEEFLVVLPHTDTTGAQRFAERLSERIDRMDLPHGLRVTFSGGVGSFPVHGGSVRQLLHNADAALYEAKLNGKAHVRAARPEKRSARRHAADLRALCYLDGTEIGEVRLHDISAAGVSVEAGTMLDPGQTIRFRIDAPDASRKPGAFDVVAQVVWSRQLDELEWRLGGRWEPPGSDAVQTLLQRVAGE